jgi:hypothetical protein
MTEGLVSTTPLQGDTAAGHSWPSIGGNWRQVLYPHSAFGLVVRVSATHKRNQTVAGPPQSPTRSFEGSGSQTDPQPTWYNGRAGIMIFAAPWRERDIARRVRHG